MMIFLLTMINLLWYWIIERTLLQDFGEVIILL